MLAYSSFLLLLTAGCDDKGSDSAGAESDTDTDTDSDTDTDTDTDADLERHLEGTLHVTVTDATGKKALCDTTVDITGEEFAGSCLFCDFTLDIETTVVSEKGSDCDYAAYPIAQLMETPVLDDLFLGWSDTYGTYEDVLWFGFAANSSGYPGPYWQYAIAYGGGTYTSTSYENGIDWTRSYNLYGYTGTPLTYCDYPAFTPYSPNYGGAYTGTGSLNCSYVTPYENWTFQGIDNGYAYISVDTVSKDTAFNPLFYVSSSDSCWTGFGDESFDCTFPAPDGLLCPSLALPTETGETYTVSVRPATACEVATGEYEILVDTKGDPSLKQAASGELTPYAGHLSAEGDTTITLK